MARVSLFDHRKFKRLALLVGGKAVALGSLELMWHVCYQLADDFLGDESDVEVAAEWMGEAGKLCSALVATGFIEECPDGSERPGYRVHDLFDHAPTHVKLKLERELARKESGETLEQARSRAGAIGRAKQLEQSAGQVQANENQVPDKSGQARAPEKHLPASVGHVPPKTGKSGTSGGVGLGFTHAPGAGAIPRGTLAVRWHDAAGVPAGDGLTDLVVQLETAAHHAGLDPDPLFEPMIAEYLEYRKTCSPGKVPSLTPRKLLEHFADVWERLFPKSGSPVRGQSKSSGDRILADFTARAAAAQDKPGGFL